jgi:hypothetical protein
MSSTSPIEANSQRDEGAVRLKSVKLDGRTRAAKRMISLVKTYAAALGGWSSLPPAKQALVERAARLRLISDQTQERYMRGDTEITADDLVRVERLAQAAETKLGIRHQGPQHPTLQQYLAERGAR